MTIRHMKIFLTIVEEGCNTTRAAERLNMTQPGVSLALKELEDHYGIRFFDRLGRHLVLSKAGEEYLAKVVHILSQFDELEERAGHWDGEGVLRVGSSVTIGSRFLPSYVSVFSSLHPSLDIRVMIGPGHSLEEKLLSNQLDLALVEGTVHDGRLDEIGYMDDCLVGICASTGPFRNGETVDIDSFRPCRFLLREKGSGTRDTFDLACEHAGFVVSPVWESTSTSAIVEATISGLGVAVLPLRLVQSACERGLVNMFTVEGLNLSRLFRIVHHKDKFLTPTMKDFIAFVRNFEEDYPLPGLHGLF